MCRLVRVQLLDIQVQTVDWQNDDDGQTSERASIPIEPRMSTLAVTRFKSLPTSYNSIYPFQQYLTQLPCLTNRGVSDRSLVGMTIKQQSNELFVNAPFRGLAMWV